MSNGFGWLTGTKIIGENENRFNKGKENFYSSFLGCPGQKHHGLEHLMLFQSISVCARVCVKMKGKKVIKSNQARKKERKKKRTKERTKKKKQTKKKKRRERSSSIKFFSLWIVTRVFVKTTTTTTITIKTTRTCFMRNSGVVKV